MATPRYKALSDLFIAPYLVRKGSVFETASSPSHHMEPLNDEARAAMEVWYEEEIPEIDSKTGLPVRDPVSGEISMIKPHRKFRTVVYTPAEAAAVTLIAAPAADDMTGLLDLGTAKFARPGDGELRPAPDPVHAPVGEDGTRIIAPVPGKVKVS